MTAPVTSEARKDPMDDIPAGARALARLNASRLRLRRELLPIEDEHPAAGEGRSRSALPRRLQAMFRHWRHRMRHSPMGGMALTALQTWWHEHPLRVPGETLGRELRDAVVPTVRKHPVATVLIASAAGAALVAWRPWRWPVVVRQIKPIPSGFGRWVMRQLSQPAVQSMLAAWLVSTVKRSSEQAEPDEDDAAPASDGQQVPVPPSAAPASGPTAASSAAMPGQTPLSGSSASAGAAQSGELQRGELQRTEPQRTELPRTDRPRAAEATP